MVSRLLHQDFPPSGAVGGSDLDLQPMCTFTGRGGGLWGNVAVTITISSAGMVAVFVAVGCLAFS